MIRGSAINQDGASNGLTAPNGPAQERVIRQALANAGLTPSDVDAVEAHGTGTRLGDPIEAQAIIATYGQHRPADQPLWLGSIKSNIGHTQAAAGVAGVIKMVHAIRHGILPQTLHIDTPTDHVDWTTGNVALLREPIAWPETGRPRRAGVSSFGISGTNAHLILEAPPTTTNNTSADTDTDTDTAPPVLAWLLSAKTEPALKAQATQLHTHLLTHPNLPPAAVARTLATRTHHPHRAAITGTNHTDLLTGLTALISDQPAPHLVQGQTTTNGKTAFLFTGQGSQHPGMGRELYNTYPVFAAAIDDTCQHFDLPQPLKQVMFAEPGTDHAALLDNTLYTQPALFTLETALYHLLHSMGVQPDYLAGHSIGELTAAHVAGILSLPDACTLVAARAQLMHQLPTTGTMIAIQATEHELLPTLTATTAIAALNTPTTTVITGDRAALEHIANHWRQQGRKTKHLNVSHAFHSPQLDPILHQYHQTATQLTYHPPTIPIITTLTGQPATHQLQTPDHWTNQVRQPVRYTDTITTLHTHGTTTYLELGPDTTLTTLTHDNLPTTTNPTTILTLPTLRPNQPEPQTLTTTLAHTHTHGTPIHFNHTPTPPIDLPTYPFQRESYWLNAPGHADVAAAGLPRRDTRCSAPRSNSPTAGTCSPAASPAQSPLARRPRCTRHRPATRHRLRRTRPARRHTHRQQPHRRTHPRSTTRPDPERGHPTPDRHHTHRRHRPARHHHPLPPRRTRRRNTLDPPRHRPAQHRRRSGPRLLRRVATSRRGPRRHRRRLPPPRRHRPRLRPHLPRPPNRLAPQRHHLRRRHPPRKTPTPPDSPSTPPSWTPQLHALALVGLDGGTRTSTVRLPFSWTGVTLHAAPDATQLRVRLDPGRHQRHHR